MHKAICYSLAVLPRGNMVINTRICVWCPILSCAEPEFSDEE